MLTALKPFRMAGVQYGPRLDRTPYTAAVQTATEAREAVLAQPFAPGEEATREALLADAADRLGRAQAALAVAKIPRTGVVAPAVWQAQRPRLRAQLLRGKFVLQTPDGVKPTRKGSRARRAEVLAASR